MSSDCFAPVRNRLGFGCMRFPVTADGKIDETEVTRMVDRFIEKGFNYFDTAHGYLDGRSETTLRHCLTSRHDRSTYLLADKLSNGFFEKAEDIIPLFDRQLERCGVSYFDYYLMHALNARTYSKYVSADAFRICAGLREEGKIRHLGMSFHDSADVLDRILDEQPGIEFVQLQINYLDWESETVQARKCYETCQKHGKKVIVMEPVKGGTLSQLLPEADSVFDRLEGRMSNAAYALRFVMGLENVSVILSGMSTPAQVEENTDLFLSAGPLSDEEMKAVDEVRDITLRHGAIACTACRYCTEVCPVGMPVPEIFSLMNSGKEEGYDRITEKTKAGDCLHCGKCEAACPQHLPVRRYLDQAAFRFEK